MSINRDLITLGRAVELAGCASVDRAALKRVEKEFLRLRGVESEIRALIKDADPLISQPWLTALVASLGEDIG